MQPLPRVSGKEPSAGRGSHIKDRLWFSEPEQSRLRQACRDLSWLLSHGYNGDSALKLVGDHYSLVKRQRDAIARCSASSSARAERARRALRFEQLRGRKLAVDGFNCLICIEVALSGGVVLVGLDGAHRDLASVHGTYRRVRQTERSAKLLLRTLADAAPSKVVWFLDSPVSNSGRLAQLLRSLIAELDEDWSVKLVPNADKSVVSRSFDTAVSADSWVLDRAGAWFDLPGSVLARKLPQAWLVDLRSGQETR